MNKQSEILKIFENKKFTKECQEKIEEKLNKFKVITDQYGPCLVPWDDMENSPCCLPIIDWISEKNHNEMSWSGYMEQIYEKCLLFSIAWMIYEKNCDSSDLRHTPYVIFKKDFESESWTEIAGFAFKNNNNGDTLKIKLLK